jgi:hypothetical protein
MMMERREYRSANAPAIGPATTADNPASIAITPIRVGDSVACLSQKSIAIVEIWEPI